MIKELLLLASAVSDALLIAPTPRRAANGEVTDITTSSAYHDLCLLFNDGDFSTFSPFGDTYRSDRRLDYFDLLATRPYGDDVYLYFYYDNRTGGDTDKPIYSPSASYCAAIHAETSSGFDVTDFFNLELVGGAYRSGDEYLVKYVARGVFESYSVGDEMGLCVFGFGKEKDGEIDEDWSFNLSYQQNFTYDDDNYDITSRVWGEGKKTVSLIEPKVVPMLIKNDNFGNGVTSIFPGYNFSAGSDKAREVFYYFFDMDRSIESIVNIDVSYNLVSYRKKALYRTVENTPATVAGGQGIYSSVIESVPDGFNFETGDSYESKHVYKQIKKGKIEVKQTYRGAWSGFLGFLGVRPDYPYKLDLITQLSRNYGAISDDNVREWFNQNGRKENGSLYDYAIIIESDTVREWDKNTITDVTNWWERLVGSTIYDCEFTAHATQGVTGIKMTAMKDGKELPYNLFSKPVDSSPAVYVKDHNFTFGEIIISFSKQANGWISTLILTAYYALSALVVILVAFAILNSGKQKVTLETPKDKKKKRGGRR